MADKQSPRRALLEKAVNGYEVISDADRQACQAFNEEYKRFIDAAKTERETVDYAVAAAQAAGFRPYRRGDALKPGDRICTIGGIYGTIASIKDDTITLYVGAQKFQMVVARWAIRSV